jgi:hypothetical protein
MLVGYGRTSTVEQEAGQRHAADHDQKCDVRAGKCCGEML